MYKFGACCDFPCIGKYHQIILYCREPLSPVLFNLLDQIKFFAITINFRNTVITRLYTADAVWYRHPSGQPTNLEHFLVNDLYLYL